MSFHTYSIATDTDSSKKKLFNVFLTLFVFFTYPIATDNADSIPLRKLVRKVLEQSALTLKVFSGTCFKVSASECADA
jgi:hypothetical protein